MQDVSRNEYLCKMKNMFKSIKEFTLEGKNTKEKLVSYTCHPRT